MGVVMRVPRSPNALFDDDEDDADGADNEAGDEEEGDDD